MRKPCSNSNLAQKNVPHSESFAVHALICKTLTNQGFADKKNSAFQQNCSKNGVPSLGAGDEESAEAPPAADEARRFRGSVPAVGCGSRRQPADTTVSAEAHTKKTPPVGWCFWSGRRGSNSLPGIPRMAVAIRRSPASPLDLTRFAQVEAASSPVLRHIPKRIPHPVGWGILFWSGRRGSNSLPRPWQGRALPDELRPQTAPLLRHLGASGRSRTNDTRIFSPLLYQLSYRGIWRPRRGSNPRPPA